MTICTALLVAAGSGQRFGSPVPKQYQDLAGMPILRRSVLAFLGHPHINQVLVVISPEHRDFYDKAVMGLTLLPPVAGGATRQDSVRLGLESLAQHNPPTFVMIHDAARPLISAATITAVSKELESTDGTIVARRVTDTLKRGDGNKIIATVDRAQLWRAETPQAFRFDKILAAHKAAMGAQLTDDAAVAEKAGMNVTLVANDTDNMKITNADDLERAARLIGQNFGDIRTGLGFDVHRLIPGETIILSGVPIPHNRKLEGHSDADVVLHAVVDALLGAMSAGDIGKLFPPSDDKWKGCDSGVFVREVVRRLNERGGLISHVDVTLMCEQPKIGPHREAMQKRLAELLDVTAARVSIKATTTERLGFTGREEGIAAQAIATVRFNG
jgi:2-C-methyl-D-erythritol 4-phosphate cytidylyltransferase/2-C-methyl-D-erythritol 2,4-cyclodiphosphate synthase